jgi:catechol 2,3-dioxygenase
LRVRIPSGHTLHLFAEKAIDPDGNGIPHTNPQPFRQDLKGIAPSRLEHALVFGPNVIETARFFVDVLDFRRTEQIVDPSGTQITAFLACDSRAHDFAIVTHDEPKFHHVSFWLEPWQDVLRAADYFGKYHVPIDHVPIDHGPTRHGITRGQTIYFWKPSGNRNEVFHGGYIYFPDRPVMTWTTDSFAQAIFYPTPTGVPQLQAFTSIVT